MSAAKDVTAVLSFDTQIFLCKTKLNYKQYTYYIFIKTNIYYNDLKTTQHGFNIFINNCLFKMHMLNIQHKEHVQISHVSYDIYGNLIYPEIFSGTNVSG